MSLIRSAQLILLVAYLASHAGAGQSLQTPQPQQQQTTGQVPTPQALTAGQPLESNLKGEESQSYEIKLATDQFLHVVVEQKGIDVVVALFGPDGKKLAEIDSPNGAQGPEPLSWIAVESGAYRLEVRSLEKSAPQGRYEVKITDLRASVAEDRKLLAAEKVSMDALMLQAQGTAESMQEAIEKYKQALPMWHELKNASKAAETANNIGLLHQNLHDFKRALEFYNQALSLYRAAGDRFSEANELSNIGSAYNAAGEAQKALEPIQQSLQMHRALGNREGEALSLTNLGYSYDKLGDWQKAEQFYNEGLQSYRAQDNRSGAGAVLINLGHLYTSRGEHDKANWAISRRPSRRSLNRWSSCARSSDPKARHARSTI
jgi:tetratricopeptide (TPR) repeat protein